MAAAFVFWIARSEVATMIAQEYHDGVVGEVKTRQLLSEPSDVFIDASNAAVVIGKLFLPVARKERKVARNKGVLVSLGISLGSDKTIAVVLEMRFEIGDH